MIPVVKSISEARDFFLRHADGECLCMASNGNELTVNCYPDAEKFFQSNAE